MRSGATLSWSSDHELLAIRNLPKAFSDLHRATLDLIAMGIERELNERDHEAVLKGVTQLFAVCKHPSNAAGDMTLKLASYVDMLADYPARIVIEALRQARKTYEWLPSAAELVRPIEKKIRLAEAILEAINHD